MKRILLNALAALSLLVMLLSLSMWQSSYGWKLHNSFGQTFWPNDRVSLSRDGVFTLHHFAPPGGIASTFTIHYWIITWLAAILPAWRIRAYIQRRQRGPDPSLCRVCGYDIRATPNRCPECGSSIDHRGNRNVSSSPKNSE